MEVGSLLRIFSGSDYGFSDPEGIAYDGNHIWIRNFDGKSLTALQG